MISVTPKLKRRIVLFAAGLSAGVSLAVFAFVLPARLGAGRPAGCGTCPGPVASPASVSDEGFEKLGPPRPGEWRAAFHEKPQTFEDYVRSGPNRKCAHRSTFYIQPLLTPPGRRSFVESAHDRFEKAIGLMREYAEIYFNVPAKVLEPIPMFEDTLDADRGQCDGSKIIDRLARRIPADALVYIGITEDDLYAKGLNFVFGVGSLGSRTGVYSLRRYDTKDESLFFRRSLKLMAHEVGHIFSIEHCVTWRCVMQGANTLAEDDSHPMYLCPIDLRKLEWNTGFDRAERSRKLFEFYRRLGLKDDADWIEPREKADR
jgi:archaemetzincin